MKSHFIFKSKLNTLTTQVYWMFYYKHKVGPGTCMVRSPSTETVTLADWSDTRVTSPVFPLYHTTEGASLALPVQVKVTTSDWFVVTLEGGVTNFGISETKKYFGSKYNKQANYWNWNKL